MSKYYKLKAVFFGFFGPDSSDAEMSHFLFSRCFWWCIVMTHREWHVTILEHRCFRNSTFWNPFGALLANRANLGPIWGLFGAYLANMVNTGPEWDRPGIVMSHRDDTSRWHIANDMSRFRNTGGSVLRAFGASGALPVSTGHSGHALDSI